MIKTLAANQNPASFKELKHLKWQATTVRHAYKNQRDIVRWCGC